MTDTAEIPEELQELSPDQFRSWKFHPISKAFRRYLSDFRAALLRDHQARWLANEEFPGKGEDEARFRAAVIQDILDLEPETIRTFYFGPEDGEGDIDKAVQEQPKVIEEEV